MKDKDEIFDKFEKKLVKNVDDIFDQLAKDLTTGAMKFFEEAEERSFENGKQAMAKSLWEAYQSIGQVSPNMRLFSKEEALDILLEIIRKEAFGDKVLPEDFAKEVPIHE